MDMETIVQEIAALPAEKQAEVADFVAFISARCRNAPGESAPARSEIRSFVGMWADRADMADSAAYVRRLRANEWKIPHE